jgi:hypothetical protein
MQPSLSMYLAFPQIVRYICLNFHIKPQDSNVVGPCGVQRLHTNMIQGRLLPLVDTGLTLTFAKERLGGGSSHGSLKEREERLGKGLVTASMITHMGPCTIGNSKDKRWCPHGVGKTNEKWQVALIPHPLSRVCKWRWAGGGLYILHN